MVFGTGQQTHGTNSQPQLVNNLRESDSAQAVVSAAITEMEQMLTKTGGLIPFEEPPAFGDVSENPVLNPDNRQKDRSTNGPSSMFDSFD